MLSHCKGTPTCDRCGQPWPLNEKNGTAVRGPPSCQQTSSVTHLAKTGPWVSTCAVAMASSNRSSFRANFTSLSSFLRALAILVRA